MINKFEIIFSTTVPQSQPSDLPPREASMTKDQDHLQNQATEMTEPADALGVSIIKIISMFISCS